MVFNLSPFTLVALALIALFIYGPDKLPQVVGDAARSLRWLRTALRGATDGVRKELGPEYQDLKLQDLNPRSFIRKHLLEEEKAWERPEPLWEPGPKPDGWPVNVPFPSAAEMGMKEGEDAFTAAIPRSETRPVPPLRKTPEAVAGQEAPSAEAGAQRPSLVKAEAQGPSLVKAGGEAPLEQGQVPLEQSGEPSETARSQA